MWAVTVQIQRSFACYLFWKHLYLNLAFQSIAIRQPVAVSEHRKPTHLTRGSPDTISELSKELLHLTLLLAVILLVNLPSWLIYSPRVSSCIPYITKSILRFQLQLICKSILPWAEKSQILFVSTDNYYQNTFFETVKMGQKSSVSVPVCLFPASAFLPLH